MAPSPFLAESITAGVNGGCVASSLLFNCPVGAAHMVDHLIQELLVSLGKALGNGVPRIIGFWVTVGGWSNSAECHPRGSDVL